MDDEGVIEQGESPGPLAPLGPLGPPLGLGSSLIWAPLVLGSSLVWVPLGPGVGGLGWQGMGWGVGVGTVNPKLGFGLAFGTDSSR